MANSESDSPGRSAGTFAALSEPTFRRIWSASLFSNFGYLILGVGAAWEMTKLTPDPSMVALVQSALMLPMMLVALPAGALADMLDRRKIALAGLSFAALSAAVLTAMAFGGMTTPWMLLGFCVLIGAGSALFSPSWQASIGEQVSNEHLPGAVALGTISYNVARSFGPALGGIIVLQFGAKAAFLITALFYLPLLTAFWFWERKHLPSRLPPERIDRAIVSGARYALHAAPVRAVLLRSFIYGLTIAPLSALAPLIAKDHLKGDAGTYGLLLGAAGIGAVIGALQVSKLRDGLGAERSVRLLSVVTGSMMVVLAFTHLQPAVLLIMLVTGGSSTLVSSLLNVGIQLSAPRWVTARALSLYSSALTGGIAIGAWGWGSLVAPLGLEKVFLFAGATVMVTTLTGVIFPLPKGDAEGQDFARIPNDPEVRMELSMRSGPVTVEVEYDVDPADARDFYDAMRGVQKVRLRNGGYNWTISRDIAQPNLWIERYHCPTWGDYLRMRSRYTEADSNAQEAANRFSRERGEARVRRMLMRPYGSVRWQANSPDPGPGAINYIGP